VVGQSVDAIAGDDEVQRVTPGFEQPPIFIRQRVIRPDLEYVAAGQIKADPAEVVRGSNRDDGWRYGPF
jgi:hypothetical protein